MGSAIVPVGKTLCDTYIICQESHFVVTLDNHDKFERKQLSLTSVELQSVALADQTQLAVLTNSSATLDQKFNLLLSLLLPRSGLKLLKNTKLTDAKVKPFNKWTDEQQYDDSTNNDGTFCKKHFIPDEVLKKEKGKKNGFHWPVLCSCGSGPTIIIYLVTETVIIIKLLENKIAVIK